MEMPRIGDMFAGYQVEELLGAGGFASVYGARRNGGGESVALKVLRPDGATYASDTVGRFKREAAILAQLRDPHVVHLIESGTSPEGLLYLVFERVYGEDLSEALKRNGRLGAHEAVAVLTQVLQALREAHGRGLVHRDIKPENIRVQYLPSGEFFVRLLDFGIARATDAGHPSVTRTGELIGTPRYMSPEQLLERPLLPASDVYSLGLVTLELLLGREALRGYSLGEQLDRLRSDQIVAADELVRLGSGLKQLLERMTALDPAHRYQSAAAVLAAVEHLRAHAQPAPTAPQPVHLGSRVPGPQRALLASGAVVAVVVTLVSFVLVRERTPLPTERSDARPRVNPLASHAPVKKVEPPPAAVTVDAGTPALVTRARDGEKRSSGCGKPAPPERAAKIDGVLRYLPEGYDPDVAHPTLVLLHTDYQRPGDLLFGGRFDELADRERLVVIAPTDPTPNVGRSWRDYPGDQDVVASAYKGAAATLCLDRARTFLVANGDGARAADGLLCAPWVTAVAVNGHLSDHGQDPFAACRPDKRAAAILLTPTESRRLPTNGTKGCLSTSASYTLKEFEDLWRARNGCGGEPRPTAQKWSAVCETWTCDTPFETCRLDGGEGWPGAPVPDAICGELPPADFPSTDHVWGFFERTPPIESPP